MRLGFALPDLSAPPPLPDAPPPDPALLEAARAEGEAEGHARGYAQGLAEGIAQQRAAQEAAIGMSLAALATALEQAMDHAEAVAVRCAEALAGTLFAAADAAFAARIERDGLVEATVTALLPALTPPREATLRVAPALAEVIVARLPGCVTVKADAALAPGEARLEWPDGARIVSAAARREAVRAALAAAGFGGEDA
ncbi:hypothetical protein [Falsiroseomonas sp. HW251]|uniref:hypothetical protein n=1 Tax=Falsiroseomonas sp. HW251 TaxID=3390998 RepID=UPI003D31A9AD